MSQEPPETDSFERFDAAASKLEAESPIYAAYDPCGPGLNWQVHAHATAKPHEAQPAPVYASPSIAPSRDLITTAYDLGDAADAWPSGRKKRVRRMAGSVLVIAIGLSAVGAYSAQQSRAEEQRVAEIEQIKQRMVEIEAQQRAERAAVPSEPTRAAPPSTVAALLTAATRSHGITNAHAERPRGVSNARQAAAIKRALSRPSPADRGRAPRTARSNGKPRAAKGGDSAAMPKNRSRDPLFGL